MRPDLYIFAGVPAGRLDAAVDELLAMLADPPTPPPSTARMLMDGAATGVSYGVGAVVGAGKLAVATPRYVLDTIQHYYMAPAEKKDVVR